MTGRPPLITSSWRTAWDLDRAGRLDFLPVRTSLGKPKWWAEAAAFPYVSELAPAGRLFHLDGEGFERAYLARLDGFGIERIAARLNAIYEEHRRPCALMCFENVHAGEACHRRLAARWLEVHTGQEVPER